MRPTLGHARPRATRYLSLRRGDESALVRSIRELYLRPFTNLRDVTNTFLAHGRHEPWPAGQLETSLGAVWYTPVWSVAEDDMTRFVTSEGPR